MMLTVRVDDRWWLHSIAPSGAMHPVSFTTSMRGPLVASWSMVLPRGFTHPALRQGAIVRVYAGLRCIWSGTMAEPDRINWEFTADGLHRRGERFDALYTSSSKTLDAAIDDAITRGLPWKRPASLSTAYTVTDKVTITQALDAWAEQAGVQWMVDADGNVRSYGLPSTPTLALSPDVPSMPTADDDYASALIIEYSSGVTTATDAAAADRYGPAEERIDRTSLGLSASQGVGAALLANRKARPAYTEGVEVSQARISTLGGTPLGLWQVRAGIDRASHRGVLNSDGVAQLGPASWVVGATSYTDGEDTISLTPFGRLPRATAEVVAAQRAAIEEALASTA